MIIKSNASGKDIKTAVEFTIQKRLSMIKSGFEITTEIVHDSHDFHDKIFVVHDFLAESTIFGAFFEVK